LKTCLAALAVSVVAAGPALAQEKLKVGFVYVGPIGDYGYSYQHEMGRLDVEKKLGDKVETTYLENIPEDDCERAIEQLARSGHKLIFTTSFGFMDPTIRVAQKFPDVKFEHATGFKRADNVATYAAKFNDGRYITGIIAGKMTKSNIIGYIGAFPIPEVVSGINAYYLGAKSVNPDVKIKVVWAGTWYDPTKEADAAKALLDQGVDVLAQHTDSPAPLQAAEARGKLGFGQATDMKNFAPKAQLTAIIDNWGDYYVERTQLLLDGKWKSEDTWFGIDKNMIIMGEYANMPDDVKKLAREAEEKIRTHALDPFQCPLKNQAGEDIKCEGGDRLSDDQVRSMNYFVEGIDEKVPQ
jgi:simple sugar transport system substrate-binding protein